LPTVPVDFQNADERGRVRLNTEAALMAIAPLNLAENRVVMLVDGELSAEGRVEFSDEEQMLVAVVDWEDVLATAR
jgi:hypothetical protein